MLKFTHFLGAYLKTGDLMFPGGKKKFAIKKQFIVRMCDFEFELKILHMHLIYQFLINDNISGVRSVDIVIKRLLVFLFDPLFSCFLHDFAFTTVFF